MQPNADLGKVMTPLSFQIPRYAYFLTRTRLAASSCFVSSTQKTPILLYESADIY